MSLQRRSSIPRRLIALSLLALSVVMLTAAISPKVRLSMVWAAGRCNGCSFRDAVASHDLLVKVDDIAREIGAASRVIETDPKEIELVETPQGRYWTVHNDKFLRFTLAEQKLAIYGEHASGVHRGDIVFDCGANVGVFTRTALQEGAQLVDIEGAEKKALTGATQTIRRYHPRMAISSEHLPDDVTAIPALVSRLAPYTVKSSSCIDSFLRTEPEVLLFQPR
jgi:hypothetical protein